jgi:effector-binding domain-containing protein
MKALKYIGILLLTLLALFLVLGLIAPKKSHLEKSTVIAVSPEKLQDIVARFSEYDKWSPWLEYDPNVKSSTEGEDGKVGSIYRWEGNKDIGKGIQTITKVEPGYVGSHLQFIEPMAGEAEIGMKLVPENGGTKVTWSFDSESPYPMNAMSLFFPIEKMIGPDYEKGLAKLKAYAESKKPTSYRGFEVKAVENQAKWFVGLRKTVDFKDIANYLEQSYRTIGEAMSKANVQASGKPVGLYYTYDEKTQKTDMVAAMPIAEKKEIPGLQLFEWPAGMEATVDFTGLPEKIGDAHYAISDFIKANQWKEGVPVVEEYVVGPGEEKDPAKWMTRVIYQIVK